MVNESEGDEGDLDSSYHDDDDHAEDADEEDTNNYIQEQRTPVNKQIRRSGRGARASAGSSPASSFHFSPTTASAPSRPVRRSSRAASREPEFIMPSIHEDGGLSGSWAKASNANVGRSTASLSQASPRKRNTRAGTPSTMTQEVWDDGSQYTSGRKPKGRKNPTRAVEAEDQSTYWVSILQPIAIWLLDITGGVFKALKTPISYAIALYLFLGLIALVRNLLTSSIYTALSPICRIPGTSLLGLPMCKSTVAFDQQADPSAPVEFDQLMTVQNQFEEILSQSAVGISLPLDMKRGETSIRDLRQIVRFSHLPSRNELVLEFDGFVETARMASYDLQKFNSHVGRAVDNVLSTARWTRRVLDDISNARSSRGLLPAFINDKILAPFQPINTYNSEAALLDQYLQHTRLIENEIQTLISEAQALLLILTNLEDRLEIIHSISLRDNIAAQSSKEEILTHLWTMLGGNRVALGKYNTQLQLLRHVGDYRKSAWAHVSGVVLRLQAMGAELEELRERVGSAEVVGLGDRGTGGREIPLSLHVENIEMGVERLERARGEAKRLESEHLRKVLDRGEGGVVEGNARMVEGR